MNIVVYGLPTCPKCEEVKKYLTSQSVPFIYSEVGKDIVKEQLELVVSRNVQSVPVITFNESEVGFLQLKEEIRKVKEVREARLNEDLTTTQI